MLRHFVLSTDKIYQWDFPKAALQSALYLTYYQQKIDKNAMLRNFVPSTDKI